RVCRIRVFFSKRRRPYELQLGWGLAWLVDDSGEDARREEGCQAVSASTAAGFVPAAIEMMDALAIEAAEEAVHCNYPAGAGAVLLVELDGPAAEVEAELSTVHALCEAAGATEIRAADDPAERAGIWAGRKSAFAAVGRI